MLSFPFLHLGFEEYSQSNPLKWESKHGSAFTHGILYRDGGLQVNVTGLYFVYSHVEFIFNDCKPRDALTHTVYIKRGEKIKEQLMNDHREGFCQSKSIWTAGSNLGSMHELRQSDWVFVNVSHPDKLSTDQKSNYFGLFKLPWTLTVWLRSYGRPGWRKCRKCILKWPLCRKESWNVCYF